MVGRDIPVEIADRRAGDPAVLIADISLAAEVLKWTPKRDIENMVRDTWESQSASTSH